MQSELAQLVALMREMNERLKRIEENTRPSPVVADGRQFGCMNWNVPIQMLDPKPETLRYPADLDGVHHVADPK